jgi:hypothetical protein
VVELAARSAARDVFEWTGLLVDVDEVEERLEQMAVVEVAVPALRGAAVVSSDRGRVPDVEVLELRPHPEVGVRDVEEPRVQSEPKPRVVEAHLDVVGVLADDELLAFPPAQRALAACPLPLELGLRLDDKAVRLRLEAVPRVGVGDELRERDDCIAVRPQAADDVPLEIVECRRLMRVAAARRPVAEQTVVQLVGRHDPSPLERAGDPMDAGGELRALAVHCRQG